MLILTKCYLVVVSSLLLPKLIELDTNTRASFAACSDLHEVHLVRVLEVSTVSGDRVLRQNLFDKRHVFIFAESRGASKSVSPVLKKTVGANVIKQVNLFVFFTRLTWIIKETKLLFVLVDTDANIHLPLLRECEHGGFHPEDSLLVVAESLPMCAYLVDYTLLILNFIMAQLFERAREVAPGPIKLSLLRGLRWELQDVATIEEVQLHPRGLPHGEEAEVVDVVLPSYLVDAEVAPAPLKDRLAVAGGEDHVLIGLLDLRVTLHKLILHGHIPLVCLIVRIFVLFFNIAQHHVFAAVDKFHFVQLNETVFDGVVVLADTIVDSLEVVEGLQSILLGQVPCHHLEYFLVVSEAVGLDLRNVLVIFWIKIR